MELIILFSKKKKTIDVSVDVMDVSGAQQTNIDHNIFKVRLNKNGEVIDNQPTKQSIYFNDFLLYFFKKLIPTINNHNHNSFFFKKKRCRRRE